jgi:GxxExxY protein
MQQEGGKAGRFGDCSEKVIGACIEVHRAIGPGLLESAYEECLAHELTFRSLTFERQKPLPVDYKGVRLECGYRLDFIIERHLIVEIKAVERLLPVHQAQVLTYLRLSGLRAALLVNFHADTLRRWLRRLFIKPDSFPSFSLPVSSPLDHFEDTP